MGMFGLFPKLIFLAVFSSCTALANNVELEPITVYQDMLSSFHGVRLWARGDFIGVKKTYYNLNSFGAGMLQERRLWLFSKRIYVVQLFGRDREAFTRLSHEPLGALEKQEAVALRITFISFHLSDSFRKELEEAFKANAIDLTDEKVAGFLDVLTTHNVKPWDLLYIGGEHIAGEDAVRVQWLDHKPHVFRGKNLIKTLFAPWLGKPGNSELARLREEILTTKPQ